MENLALGQSPYKVMASHWTLWYAVKKKRCGLYCKYLITNAATPILVLFSELFLFLSGEAPSRAHMITGRGTLAHAPSPSQKGMDDGLDMSVAVQKFVA